MKNKNIKPEEVEVVIPKEVEAINICGDIDKTHYICQLG